MPDIYFTCKTCGKCLVADDALAGLTTTCPGCNTGAMIPTVVIVHPCPHCDQRMKFTSDLKGEVVDCTSCKGEVFLPGHPDDAVAAPHPERLVDYVCPKCGAEIEALAGEAEQLAACPSCDKQVRLRRKLHVRTGSTLAPAADGSQSLPTATPSREPERSQWRNRINLSTLLRYGVVDLLLLTLFFIPLPALNGHNFLYVLKVSFSGSDPGSLLQKQSKPSDSRTPNPARSEAWNNGYYVGQTRVRMDREAGTFDHMVPTSADRTRFAVVYAEGTAESDDFWDGYHHGYTEKR